MRPLLRFYLECLTGEQIELKPDTPQSEEFLDLLTADSNPDPTPDSKEDVKPR
jgi:hypothetical protein